MNNEFLKKVLWKAHYSLKEGSSASFLYAPYAKIDSIQDKRQKKDSTILFLEYMEETGQELLLPLRLYFIAGDDLAPVCKCGRGARKKVRQMKGQFTAIESSPYKIAKPYKTCTSVWQVEGRKLFFYGTIGITQAEKQKPLDNGDLVLFFTADWKEVDIFIFRGLAKPNEIANLQEAVQFVEKVVLNA